MCLPCCTCARKKKSHTGRGGLVGLKNYWGKVESNLQSDKSNVGPDSAKCWCCGEQLYLCNTWDEACCSEAILGGKQYKVERCGVQLGTILQTSWSSAGMLQQSEASRRKEIWKKEWRRQGIYSDALKHCEFSPQQVASEEANSSAWSKGSPSAPSQSLQIFSADCTPSSSHESTRFPLHGSLIVAVGPQGLC